jgi:hypothetical protein
MKFAFFNPTAIAVDDIPDNLFTKFKTIVDTAHKMTNLNDAGDQSISVRGGQQIQLLPNEFGLDTSLLSKYVEDRCQEYIDSIMQQSGRTDLDGFRPKMISAWTIKQNPTDYQAMHDHQAHISGSIFIEVPNLNTDSNISDGNLELRLPVIRDPAKFVFVDQCRIVPTLKSMTIFPSYLPHTVYPWKGTGHRTVLAWDVVLIPKEE